MPARGTLVAYATAPGSVAADGDGKNGLYTEELLEALRESGLKIEEVFKRVRINVARRSKGAQTPWESSSLTGDLVVNVTVNVTAAAVSPAQAPDREGLFWLSIKDSTDPAAFEAYLKQYPQGTFAPLARQRLASVSQPARPRDLGRFDGGLPAQVVRLAPAHREGHRAHRPGHQPARLQHVLGHVRGSCLSVRACDARELQPLRRPAVELRGELGQPYTGRRQADQSRAALHLNLALDDDRRSPCIDRVRHIGMTVHLDAFDRDEEVARLDAARVVRDTRDLHVAVAFDGGARDAADQILKPHGHSAG